MSDLSLGTLGILLLLILLILRVHVGLSLGLVGFIGFWLVSGDFNVALSLLTTTPFKTVANYSLIVLPLFILMGSFAGHAGLAEAGYRAAQKWVGRLPGGLAIATTIANAAFGAVSGSSIAACAVFTRFSLPEMERHGYDKYFACATICSAGLLAMLIPPSLLMIVYGIMTEQSIGALFIAGIFPGLLLTVLYSVAIIVMVKMKPALADRRELTVEVSLKGKLRALKEVWGIILLMMIVIIGIYGGLFTPTEAGAAGAFSAFVIALVLRKLNWKTLKEVFVEAASTTGMIFFILIGATIYSKFLAVSGLTDAFLGFILDMHLSSLGVLLAFMGMYLFLGCLLDSISMLTITLPLVIPVSLKMGWDPIWFAILVIMAIEIGLVTPPLGLNVYTVKAAAGPQYDLEGIFRANFPFFLIMLFTLALIIIFPQISTWLPGLMKVKAP